MNTEKVKMGAHLVFDHIIVRHEENAIEGDMQASDLEMRPIQTVGELRADLRVFIYMSLCHLPKRAAYWNTDRHKPIHEVVRTHICQN